MKTLKIIRPDDWHVHFREGKFLEKLVLETCSVYQRSIVMPNLKTPITTLKLADKYKREIVKFSSSNKNFQPLITFYLTENINIDELIKAYKKEKVFAVKLYPFGATTNSSKGIKNIEKIFLVLEKMSKYNIPLLIHGEVNSKKIDIFDREKAFIDNYLKNIHSNFPNLKITLEHITTKYAVHFVNQTNSNLKASITPHHLIINRSDMLEHKIKPHYYCLPILKREEDRKALLEMATSGNENFFLGTDSAPHTIEDKENACGCAGIFNTINSIEMLIQLFENEKKLNNLEKFVSINGSKHYELPINNEFVIYEKTNEPLDFPNYLNIDKKDKIKIFKPPFNVYWKLAKG